MFATLRKELDEIGLAGVEFTLVQMTPIGQGWAGFAITTMIEITAIQKARRQLQLPVVALRGVELEGFTRFYLDVNISADTMREWSVRQITDFFDGVAKVIYARGKA